MREEHGLRVAHIPLEILQATFGRCRDKRTIQRLIQITQRLSLYLESYFFLPPAPITLLLSWSR
jgi:hypothetical protein